MSSYTHQPTKHKRYALCIGIGYYTDPAIKNLRYTSQDAQAIYGKLTSSDYGAFEPENVQLLITPEQTTAHKIKDAINDLLDNREAGPEALAVIYISAHGMLEGDTYYLLPSDARNLAETGQPAEFAKSSMLSVLEIANSLNSSRTNSIKNIVLILDTCHSGGATHALKFADFSSSTNIYILGACLKEQTAVASSRLGHSAFTKSLLDAFDRQKPAGNEGWLTVDELKGFVFEDLPLQLEIAFEGYAIDQTTIEQSKIQVISQTVAQIPLIKNPAYSPQSQAFCERIKQMLEWDDLKIQPSREVNSSESAGILPANFFTFKKYELGKLLNIGVIPYYNVVIPLAEEKLLELANWARSSIDQNEFDRIWLINDQRLSNDLVRKFERVVGHHTFTWVITAAELEESFNPFKDDYLERLWKIYTEPNPNNPAEPPLQKVYVDMQAEERVYGREKGLVRGLKEENAIKEGQQTVYWQSESLKLETFMRDWLENENESAMVIVADYGAGKTTFCDYFAAILAHERLEAHEHDKIQHRIPLVIPLRYFAEDSKAKLTSHLATFFNDYNSPYAVRNVSPHVLTKLAENGRLLFLLDGFDEMATRADQNKIITNFNLFRELISKGQNKVIITTRPEYFESLSHRLELMGEYPTIYLRLFEPEQIIDYLEKKTGAGKATYERIEGVYDLSDLASRPILLKMIAETINQFEKGEIVTRPMLYEKYLLNEHKRQLESKNRQDVKIPSNTRLKVAEWLAWKMYCTTNENTGLSDSALKDVCADNKLLSSENAYEQARELTEIRTCTYLVESAEGHRFSHKSFFEYLLARRLHQQIAAHDQQGLALYRLNLNIIEFLAELVPNLSIIKEWLVESLPLSTKNALYYNCGELLLAARLTRLCQNTRLSTSTAHSYLDPDFITNAEYMVFIHEEMKSLTNNYIHYYQPDHWRRLRHSTEQAFEPVLGISPRDCESFFHFLNKRYVTRRYQFSLPQTDPGDENAHYANGYWLKHQQHYELVGLDATTEDELTQELQEFISNDLETTPAAVGKSTHSFAYSLDLARAFEMARVSDFRPALINTLGLDAAQSSAFDTTSDTELSQARSFKYALARAFEIARTYDFTRASARNLDPDLIDILTLASTHARSNDELYKLLKNGELQAADELISQLLNREKSISIEKRRALFLLQDLVKMSLAVGWQERRQIAYRYNLNFAQFICYGYRNLLAEETKRNMETQERYSNDYNLWR